MNHYWNLIMWDGEEIKVRPENVELIQDKLKSGEGFITTPTRSIAIKSIKDFVESSEKYIDQKLLEDSSRAFDVPVIENDSILVRWVKKPITKRDYNKFYSHHPAYRNIGEQNNYIMVSWRQPVHQINSQTMEELSEDDERNLSRKV